MRSTKSKTYQIVVDMPMPFDFHRKDSEALKIAGLLDYYVLYQKTRSIDYKSEK